MTAFNNVLCTLNIGKHRLDDVLHNAVLSCRRASRMRIDTKILFTSFKLAERYDDREIERDIDELGTERSEFPGQYEASSIFDIGEHNKLKSRKGAGEKANVKQRFLNAVLKLFNKKVRNNRN